MKAIGALAWLEYRRRLTELHLVLASPRRSILWAAVALLWLAGPILRRGSLPAGFAVPGLAALPHYAALLAPGLWAIPLALARLPMLGSRAEAVFGSMAGVPAWAAVAWKGLVRAPGYLLGAVYLAAILPSVVAIGTRGAVGVAIAVTAVLTALSIGGLGAALLLGAHAGRRRIFSAGVLAAGAVAIVASATGNAAGAINWLPFEIAWRAGAGGDPIAVAAVAIGLMIVLAALIAVARQRNAVILEISALAWNRGPGARPFGPARVRGSRAGAPAGALAVAWKAWVETARTSNPARLTMAILTNGITGFAVAEVAMHLGERLTSGAVVLGIYLLLLLMSGGDQVLGPVLSNPIWALNRAPLGTRLLLHMIGLRVTTLVPNVAPVIGIAVGAPAVWPAVPSISLMVLLLPVGILPIDLVLAAALPSLRDRRLVRRIVTALVAAVLTPVLAALVLAAPTDGRAQVGLVALSLAAAAAGYALSRLAGRLVGGDALTFARRESH